MVVTTHAGNAMKIDQFVVGEKMTKTKMHDDLNKAFATLLEIGLLLGLRATDKTLKELRSFMSRMIDHSEFPGV